MHLAHVARRDLGQAPEIVIGLVDRGPAHLVPVHVEGLNLGERAAQRIVPSRFGGGADRRVLIPLYRPMIGADEPVDDAQSTAYVARSFSSSQ